MDPFRSCSPSGRDELPYVSSLPSPTGTDDIVKHITKIPNKAAHGGTTIHIPQASTSASLTGRFNILFPNNLTYAFISCLRRMKCFFFKILKFFLSFFNSFIFGCVGSLLLHTLFSSCREQGILSSCGSQASHRSGFS